MYCHHEISAICIFVITCQIAQVHLKDLNNGNNNLHNENALPGYHFEMLNTIRRKYAPGSYRIVSLSEAIQMQANSKHKSGRGHDVSSSEEYHDAEDTYTPHDETDRRKRFFSFKLPFTSSNDDTDTTVTAKSVTTSTTTDASGKDATVTTATATATAPGGKSDSSGGASDVTVTASLTTVTTDSSAGYFDRVQSGVLQIVSIGKDVKTSIVVAAPYLPMVWKVAQFLVPGLSQYQALMLAVNVATTVAESLQKYDSGQSLSSVITDAAKKAVWDSLLSKRDTGSTIGVYASNIYDSMKTTLKTHFGNIPYFSGGNTISSTTVKVQETNIDGEKVETVVTTINNEIPESKISVMENEVKSDGIVIKDFEDKIMDMKNPIKQSSESSASDSDVDDDADEVDITNIIPQNIQVDKALFNSIFQQSMKFQPDFIQNKSGEELVEYLNGLNIQLPDSVIDSRQIFGTLTSMMKFDDNVTDEQKSKLVDTLSKTTDYFIAKGLEAKQLLVTV